MYRFHGIRPVKAAGDIILGDGRKLGEADTRLFVRDVLKPLTEMSRLFSQSNEVFEASGFFEGGRVRVGTGDL